MQYLFGQPVLPAKPKSSGQRELFVLGAYPSALHVRWYVPGLKLPVQAVAVDNEPEPFWTGHGEVERIELWKQSAEFRDEWGVVTPCGKLNGSSGVWVEKHLLDVLGVTAEQAWITDCLDTYHESNGAATRLNSEAIISVVTRLGIPQRSHAPHPSEATIVRDALQHHTHRLLHELSEAKPERVVTLGNAALRVFAELATKGGEQIAKLRADNTYGSEYTVTVAGKHVTWIPLAHPAAPEVYQQAHTQWEVGMSSR